MGAQETGGSPRLSDVLQDGSVRDERQRESISIVRGCQLTKEHTSRKA